MPAAAPSQAPERLARIIDALCKAVAAHGIRGVLTAPLLLLLWGRLSRAAVRVRRLAARLAAGQPLATPRRPAPPRPNLARPPRLSRGFAWLVRAVPATAGYASQLQFLLADPEMAELAQAPPMRRLLRPLCQLLGVHLPPAPKPPAPVEAVTPKPSGDPPASAPVPGPVAGRRCQGRDFKPPPLTTSLAA